MSAFTIQNTMTLKELQDTFTGAFPYLKLEFFTEAHKAGEGSPKEQMVPEDWDESLVIKDVQGKSQVVEYPVDGELTVGRLEEYLETYFGLHAQVFRNSGGTWLETTRTDNQTLNQQNQRGAEADPANQSHENPYEIKERPER